MKESSFKYILGLTWPIFIELMLQMMMGNVDQMMIAHLSQEAVGGISNANQIMNALLLSFSMVANGTAIVVSQYKGANLNKEVNIVYSVSCALNLIISIIISFVILLFHSAFFRWMHLAPEFITPANTYIRIVGMFCCLQALFQVFSAIMRSNRLMKTGMIVSIIMNFSNVFLNALFIFFFHLGVTGAALATILSQFIGLCIMVHEFYKNLDAEIKLSYVFPFPKKQLVEILSLGIPAGGETLSYHFAQIIILSFINSLGGASTLAKSYCSMISNISLMYCSSVARATQVVAGFLVGAGRIEEASKMVKKVSLSSLAVTLPVSILIYLNSEFIFSLFNANAEVITLCKGIMFIEIFVVSFRSINRVYTMSLHGVGDVKFTVTVGIISTWAIIVGVGLFLGNHITPGIYGMWMANAIDELIRGSITAKRWMSGKWTEKRIVKM